MAAISGEQTGLKKNTNFVQVGTDWYPKSALIVKRNGDTFGIFLIEGSKQMLIVDFMLATSYYDIANTTSFTTSTLVSWIESV